jgi:hypothetical protein
MVERFLVDPESDDPGNIHILIWSSFGRRKRGWYVVIEDIFEKVEKGIVRSIVGGNIR